MSKTLTVLSRPGCVQCNATYRALDKKNLAYTVGDAMTEDNLAIAGAHGVTSAPVVVVRRGEEILEVWGGFRPDRIGVYAADPEAGKTSDTAALAA